LRFIGATIVVSLKQFGSAPAGPIKAVIPNACKIIFIILDPHCNCIAAAINRDLSITSATIVVSFDQFGGAPAGAIKIAGINVISSIIELGPHCDGIAAAIKCDLGRSAGKCVCRNRFGGAPTSFSCGEIPVVIVNQGISTEVAKSRGVVLLTVGATVSAGSAVSSGAAVLLEPPPQAVSQC
jgi:hypothetical protein